MASVTPDMSRLAIAALAAGLLTATCANAPTTPGGTESNRLVIADPQGQLGPVEAHLRPVLQATLDRAAGVLRLDDVTITVRPDRTQAIGGWGVGGFTPDGRTVNLYIDPAFPNLAAVLEPRIAQMLAHELHHAARFRGPGYGRTLLEACVSEGLADRFALELLGGDVPPWSVALQGAELTEWLARATPAFDATGYDHAAWFFGSRLDTPRWAGYAVGYHLVTRYQASHANATALSLVHTPAGAFRP